MIRDRSQMESDEETSSEDDEEYTEFDRSIEVRIFILFMFFCRSRCFSHTSGVNVVFEHYSLFSVKFSRHCVLSGGT